MNELNKIQTELKAPKGQFNSFGKYKYRNCEDILESLKPLLKENNCVVTIKDEISLIGDRYYVKARATLINSKGEKISTTAFAREPLNKKGMDEAQITGATSSYARKYALNGLFAIDDTKDADHDDNSKNNAKPNPKDDPKPKDTSKPEAIEKDPIINADEKRLLTEAVTRYIKAIGDPIVNGEPHSFIQYLAKLKGHADYMALKVSEYSKIMKLLATKDTAMNDIYHDWTKAR